MSDIQKVKKLGVKEIVFGALDKNNFIDLDLMKVFSLEAFPMRITFHKAIDLTNSPIESLKNLFELNIINGVLTSGGCQTAELGMSILKNMVDISPKDFEIISAGKITDQNINFLHEKKS